MAELVNIEPKEIALQKAGATREASYKTIVAGLTCQKMTLDKFGEEHWEADTTNQLRSAEIIARMNGDLRPETLVDNRQVNVSMAGISSEVVKGLLDMVADVKKQLVALKSSGHQTGEIIDI